MNDIDNRRNIYSALDLTESMLKDARNAESLEKALDCVIEAERSLGLLRISLRPYLKGFKASVLIEQFKGYLCKSCKEHIKEARL